ncbi:MAG: 3'(2'),5'-bisphosphate nucleotidase CysQ [Rhizobiales bacterium]|nr:3'(2'),5'-bisphosphate nucleotidase CysQ [Hyphomicrobiales bacterium]
MREAGILALKTFRGTIKSWIKDKNSPVSEADMAVNDLLHDRLSGADFGWLSEESVDDPLRLAARQVWVVDPIDGTRAYLAGLPDWTIAAALVENGRPVAAAIYAPVAAELFTATAGAGAWCNGRAIMTTDGAALDGARVAGPRSYLERLQAAGPTIVATPRVHSLALRFTRVAQGTLDAAMASENSHDWDLAAADLLVHEAGGLLTTFSGRGLTYNRPETMHEALVAAGRGRHEQLIGLVQARRIPFA